MKELNKICRACMDTSECFTYTLHENVSSVMFSFCTTIEVPVNDNLPMSLCDVCFNLLKKFSEFKHRCLQSNETLISIFNDSKENAVQCKIESSLAFKTESDQSDNDIDAAQSEHSVDIKTEHDDNINSSFDKIELPVDGENSSLKLVRPKRKIANVLRLSCDQCNRKFQNADKFEAHKLWHQGKSTRIECNICHRVYAKWQCLAQHKKNSHTIVNLGSLQCAECGKVFKSAQTLQIHEKTHNGTLAVCDVCGKELKSKVILKAHLSTHDVNRLRTLACDQCDGKFYSKAALSNHKHRRHAGRIFICHYCDYPYKNKADLIKHMIVQHDQNKKPYKCFICSKSFVTSCSLKEHTRYHSGERPYECEYCKKHFVTRRYLKDHYRIHTGEKRYKCTLCTQAFIQKGSLNRHMKVHDKPVQSNSKAS